MSILSCKNITRLTTFKDLSIRYKLLLFALGGLAWFLIVSLVALGSITYVKFQSKRLTEELSPQIQTVQKVIIKLRGANVSVHNLAIYEEIETARANIRRAESLLRYTISYLQALLRGGEIRDYSDLTGEIVEEYYVSPLRESTAGKDQIKEVLKEVENLKALLDELSSITLRSLQNRGFNKDELRMIRDKLDQYDLLTVKIVTTLDKLRFRISKLQMIYTERISSVFYRTTTILLVIGVIAIILLFITNHFLTVSMTRPLRTITEQIKDLSEGEIDLSKQIYVDSKDEIGELSSNFNMLLQSIHDINAFKKVIEEDETLEDVYTRLAKVFREGLGLNFIIFEISNSKNTMRAVTTPFSGEDICCNKEILINCNLCRAKRTGHTVSSISYPGLCRQFLRGEDMNHICIPMVMGEGTGGVVQILVDKAEHVDMQETDKKVIKVQQYIKEAVPVIEAKRLTAFLKESAVRDQMTGLYNRRFLEEYVDTLVAGVTRKKGIAGLLMCDLDFFKEVNDRFGHDVGDMVLKETAKTISRNARASDLIIRFGGEEFLLVLINGKEGEAMEVAERIRKGIEETKIRTGGVVIQKTISIGVSEFPLDTQNFWKAIKFADIALYKAKETGRNRVVRFTKEMWTEEEY